MQRSADSRAGRSSDVGQRNPAPHPLPESADSGKGDAIASFAAASSIDCHASTAMPRATASRIVSVVISAP